MDPIELERRLLKAEKWTARYRADAIVAEKRCREMQAKLLKAEDHLADVIKRYEEQGRNVRSLENSVKILREEVATLRKVPVGGA